MNDLVVGDVIIIDDDTWDMLSKKFTILSVSYRKDSTAVDLMLEVYGTKEIIHKVVAYHQIEKV